MGIITPLEAPSVSELAGLFDTRASVEDRVFSPVDVKKLSYCRSTRAFREFEKRFRPRSSAPSPESPRSVSDARLSVLSGHPADNAAIADAQERASELAARSASLAGMRTSRKTLVKTTARKRRNSFQPVRRKRSKNRNRGVSISVTVSVPRQPTLVRPRKQKLPRRFRSRQSELSF